MIYKGVLSITVLPFEIIKKTHKNRKIVPIINKRKLHADVET